MTIVAVLFGLLVANRVPAADFACDASALPEPDADYRARVEKVHGELGIPRDYERDTGLRVQYHNRNLKVAAMEPGQGVFFLSPRARDAWLEMQAAARLEGVELIMVSAHRSLRDQIRLLARRLGAGESMREVLRSNVAPGYSEHHTGDAIDLTTTDAPALDKAFADTPAFTWLESNARRYCFELSYAEDNGKGVTFEPWHWRFRRGANP